MVYADFDDAVAAYQNGDYETAYKELKPLAVQGLMQAQYGLGLMYVNGEGVPKDDEQAIYWYTKAAEQGDVDAQFGLWLIYADPDAEPQDIGQAVYWLTKAAEQGDSRAQSSLEAACHWSYVGQEYATAFKACQSLAEQGDDYAQYLVGEMHWNGLGTPQDYDQAVYLYTQSAEQGYDSAQRRLDRLLEFQQTIDLAEQGDVDAQKRLGADYLRGNTPAPQDYKQAVYWYTKAAEQGASSAQYNLGGLYAEGKDTPIDNEKAIYWWSNAAEQGHYGAKAKLEKLLETQQ